MRRTVLTLGLVAVAALAAVPAQADILLLKDGRIIEREQMEVVEKGVKVFFENGEVVIPGDQIKEALLANAPAPTDLSAADREKMAKGLVLFEGKWVKAARRDELVRKKVDARKAYVEELRKHRLWRHRYKDETKHFKFEYTVAPYVYEYFRDVMEAYYKVFAKTWKVKQPKDLGKLTVCFYTDRQKFCQIGGVSPNVLGYFRFVKPLELNFYFSRVDPAQTEQVMYHEASHYLQKLLDPDFSMPHFPGEPLAEYYGACQYDPKTKKLTVGLVLEGRLTDVKTDIAAGDVMSLEKMLKADSMYEHYTWGWTFAHFLMNDKRYRKKFEKFVKGLVAGKGVRHVGGIGSLKTVKGAEVYRYFRHVMGLKKDEQFDALEEEWHLYVRDTLQTTSTRGLEKAAQGAARVGRKIRAKRLYREAIEAGTTNPLTFHQYGEMLERGGKSTEAIEQYRKAVKYGPLESAFYASLGQALHRTGDKEAGLGFMKLALELDPDDPYLEDSIQNYIEDEDEGG